MGEQQRGPWRPAIFSDVPYILDSIWRWAEFRAYRLGRVSLMGGESAQHPFYIVAITPWPLFWAYLVISSFLVFGPTYTTLCTSFGLHAAEGIRIAAGISVLAIAVIMFLLLIVEIAPRLTRRAASQLKIDSLSPLEREDEHDKTEILETSDPKTHDALAELTKLSTALSEELRARTLFIAKVWRALKQLGGIVQALRAIRCLDGDTKKRFAIAFVLLLLGSVIVVVPFIAAGATLSRMEYDADACGIPHDAWRGIAQIVVLGFLVLWGTLLWRWKDPTWALKQLLFVTAAWGLAILILWTLVAGPHAREATGGPYPQSFAILLASLVGATLFARWLAHRLIQGESQELKDALAKTQLFEGSRSRSDPDMSWPRLFASLIDGVVYHPLHLLLLPSLVAVMAATRWVLPGAALFIAMAILLLTYGSFARRWEELILVVQRWFLSGTPLLISILVIALAIARLFDVQYVTTILDAAPIGVISALIVGAYATLWFFEYWVNRWIAERLLGLLGADSNGRSGFVRYPFPGSPSEKTISSQGRVIALHSIGEFCVQGWFNQQVMSGGKRHQHVFTVYTLTGLFDRLAPGSDAASDVTRRVKAYFALVNLSLICLTAGLLFWQRNWDRPLSAFKVVDAKIGAPARTHDGDLRYLLAQQSKSHRAAIIVAASGGGTRAALYTATALEGVAKIDLDRNLTKDIVLLSGVSGGGVAAAYFASAHDRLTLPYANSAADWTEFKRRVTEPFIEDVLDGVGELRVAADYPLGQLLAESLDRRLFTGPVKTLGGLRGPALILNATISGHPWPDSEILRDHVGVLRPEDPCPAQSQPFASLAGSRLILTNLKEVDGFHRFYRTTPPTSRMVMPDVGLGYEVIRDPETSLATAAALNANFPPVFSNARVRTDDKNAKCVGYSYFVTDGGATENLGLLSALYELRSILGTWVNRDHEVASATQSGAEQMPVPPPIHIIAIEASAITYDYTEDRGVGAATGGSKERVTGALTEELVRDIDLRLTQLGAEPLHLHYLPLPVAFRSRGGFGTHWMYAQKIRVSNPLVPKLGNRFEQWWHEYTRRPSYVFLDHDGVNVLWTALFDRDKSFCARDFSNNTDAQQVADWMCGSAPEWQIRARPDLQIDAWNCLVSQLMPSIAPQQPVTCRESK